MCTFRDNNFKCLKMKIRDFFTLTNVINVSEQHSRDFNQSDILGNANTGGIVAFKSYNVKNT